MIKFFRFIVSASIAQLVECYTFVLKVPGSNLGDDIFFPIFLYFFKTIRVCISFSLDFMTYNPIGIFLQLIGTILGGH